MGLIDKTRTLIGGGDRDVTYQCNACKELFAPAEDASRKDLRCPVCRDPNVRER